MPDSYDNSLDRPVEGNLPAIGLADLRAALTDMFDEEERRLVAKRDKLRAIRERLPAPAGQRSSQIAGYLLSASLRTLFPADA